MLLPGTDVSEGESSDEAGAASTGKFQAVFSCCCRNELWPPG